MEEAKVLQHRLIGPNIGVGLQGVATNILLAFKTFESSCYLNS